MLSIKKIGITSISPKRIGFKWDIHNSTLIPVLLLGPLMIFTSMSLADLEMVALSYGIFALVLLGFFATTAMYLCNKEMSGFGMLSFVVMLTLILLTVLNAGDIKNAIYMALEIWMFQMICYYYKDRIHIIIIVASIFLSFCVYANFIHIMMHPNLWFVEEEKSNGGYLLGNNYNGMGFRMILAVVFSTVCLKYSWKWIFNVVPVIILSIVPLVLTGSKTSLSGIAIFVVFAIIPSLRLQKIIANCALISLFLFEIFVVFSGKGLENNDFAVWLIEDVLDKDITFTYRTYLWDLSLNKIAESPIWGYGFVDNDWYASNIRMPTGTGPCNFLLEILLNGGLILITLFLTIFFATIRKISAYNEKYAVLIKMGIATIMIMHLMEMQSYTFVFFLMTLAYCYPYIKKEYELKYVSNDKIDS